MLSSAAMRRLAALETRLFAVCFVVYSAFFSTNVVREHYPAFSLIDHGNFRVDEYLGFHSDIFQHSDGHSYIDSNVTTSLFAAVPLLVFDPVLDALERHSKAQLAAHPEQVDTTYDTKYKNRRAMFRLVKLAGKDLRFGAATAITSVFLMAPLCALCVVLLFRFLLGRGVPRERAVGLSLLFAFGTPLFYRAAHLNQNVLLMAAAFGAFLLLYEPPGKAYDPSLKRRLWAGVLLGFTFAFDYSGAVPAGVIGLYYVVCRVREAGVVRGALDSLPVVLGCVPGVGFLLWAQWAQFGNPFTPAQFVMKAAHYTEEGVRGMGAPSLEIFTKNLISPGWGLYTFAPVLLLGLIPQFGKPDSELIVPHRERILFNALTILFLLFCAMNRYSLMQFNTGCRYLVVLVPFIYLQACDTLQHLKPRVLTAITVLAVLHSLVLCMTREVNNTEKKLRERSVAAGVHEYQLPEYWRTYLTETPIP
ncbi:MAG TPA: hypothetical protein VHM19_20590, partial [Polyangiales bacterium]|nr:hypothetical protein [Polyangiales bacterium]